MCLIMNGFIAILLEIFPSGWQSPTHLSSCLKFKFMLFTLNHLAFSSLCCNWASMQLHMTSTVVGLNRLQRSVGWLFYRLLHSTERMNLSDWDCKAFRMRSAKWRRSRRKHEAIICTRIATLNIVMLNNININKKNEFMEIIICSSQFWSFLSVLFSFQGCGVANLVDKYLGHLYPEYLDHTRTVLIRQARDILVCTYHGNLARFEERFLQPTAAIVSRLKDLCQHGSVSTWLNYFF